MAEIFPGILDFYKEIQIHWILTLIYFGFISHEEKQDSKREPRFDASNKKIKINKILQDIYQKRKMAINETISDGIAGSSLIGGALAGFVLIMAIAIIVGVWIYTSFAWMTISRKLKQNLPGLMWIPLVRRARILELGNFHWAWIFLLLIPVLGWLAVFILTVIAEWRIFEERKYSGALALIPIGQGIPLISWVAHIAWLVVIGLVAWKDQPKKKNK